MKCIEKKINYIFNDKNLLRQALTHPSQFKNIHYDRLEFLGDRVLNFIIAHKLFKKFPYESTGQIAIRFNNLVNRQILCIIFKSFDLNIINYKWGDKIYANFCEALIGAIFLDSNIEEITKFIDYYWYPYMNQAPIQGERNQLQEWIQSNQYTLINTTLYQKNDNGYFVIKTLIKELNIESIGEGINKKNALNDSAKKLLKKLNI